MADIQLREQFPAAFDLSVANDVAEFDVWLRQQFSGAPDLNAYPTEVAHSAEQAPLDTLFGRQLSISMGVLTPVIERVVALAGFQLTTSRGTLDRYIATDTFTGSNNTALSAHNADTGQSWTVELTDGLVGVPWIQSNRLVSRTNEGVTIASLNDSAGSVNQMVRGALRYIGNAITNSASWGGCHNAVGLRVNYTTDVIGYFFGYNAVTNETVLFSSTPTGGVSPLATASTFNPSSGNTYSFELRASGDTDVQLDCYIDGALHMSYLDVAPDSTLLVGNSAGIIMDSAGDLPAMQLDTLWWKDLGAASGDVSLSLSGLSATSARGTMVPLIAVSLSGLSMSTAQGTITGVAERVQALTGFSMTASQGSLGVALARTLTGQQAAAAQGTMTALLTIPLAGMVLAVSGGTLSISGGGSVTLTGFALAASPGALTPALARMLTGQQVAAAQGSATPTLSLLLLGQALAAAGGTISPALRVALSGAGVAAAFGTLVPSQPIPDPGRITEYDLFAVIPLSTVELTAFVPVVEELFALVELDEIAPLAAPAEEFATKTTADESFATH